MTLPTPLKLKGAPGSPYTRKMLAVLRYRHIPYQLLIGDQSTAAGLPAPKVSLLPTFYLPNDAGELEAVVDSTPLIRRFEGAFEGRNVLPHDPALRFIDYLLEDYADEWLTKAMFHYRWYYDADVDKAGDILPRWRGISSPEKVMQASKKMVSERQISRLYVVGSNDTTAPVIEASYKRFLGAFNAHLEHHPFLMGARPGASDFGAFGQLTQLAQFDPTPSALTLKVAPRVYAWVDIANDLSGLEPAQDDWLKPKDLPDTIRGLLAEAGRTYVPVMLANADALANGANQVTTEVEGAPWVQNPFPYQAKCLSWVRDEYAKLPESARQTVNDILDGTGCEPLLAGLIQ